MGGHKPLAGRTVIITGASSGIGRASAKAVADAGAEVLLLARRVDELNKVVDDIRAAGGKASSYPCDVTESESVDAALAAIFADHDHVDMLVNNAGRSIRRSLYRSVDRLHDFERTMAVNYFGAVRMILGLLPHLRERKFGHIVNVSSEGVQVSSPRFAAYLASKAALDKFTDVAATETLSDGITFTTIHMPLVETPMITPSAGAYAAVKGKSPEWAAATIVRALVERPKRIDVPMGTIFEYAALFAPSLKDRALHRYHRAYPDSAASKGELPVPPVDAAESTAGPERPGIQRSAGRLLRRAARMVPGTHW
ncbi:SDR family NAD(P)-dependent oxidoreductase [Smaragdicoccus niigatensis]|uniref:SDR family NAD(P)-dependent oxidoreductase n=1 Tax=Smaragdicoccus niigatensis TaxID=359359 RepID=UPI00036C4BE8|nr:SDR family NAD(P)-dependent oxidoreductase [Smaragdicoccus niigatensis]